VGPTKGNDQLSRRRQALAPAYELSYDEPIHIVRGEGGWLFDADGRRYLDCYNNVPSVGHCHPRVVEAIATQVRLLNTHTRYLHENVVKLGERLGSKFSEKLSACWFV
jgi:4-aminobutyrate aminotransferase-like enzyme